jgi:hypothetical protein
MAVFQPCSRESDYAEVLQSTLRCPSLMIHLKRFQTYNSGKCIPPDAAELLWTLEVFWDEPLSVDCYFSHLD